jgi:integrase/recombinase XerD
MSQRVCHLRPRDVLERQVVGVWRRARLSNKTCADYLYLIRSFRRYCRDKRLDELEHLTWHAVQEFTRRGVFRRVRRPSPQRLLVAYDNAVYAWAHALRVLGRKVPEWRPSPKAEPLPHLIAEYEAFRRAHRGVSAGTLARELSTAREFLATQRSRRRLLPTLRASDLDAFVAILGRRQCRRTLGTSCSSLRAFLRFLRATGRINRDLASFVLAPRVLWMETPPRAMPWPDVQRLLHSIRRDGHSGLRDYAVLILMIAYGLGASEIATLRLDGIDWRACVIRLHRLKTGMPLELPLLPAVARALLSYLRKGRPADSSLPEVFISRRLPRRPLSRVGVCHMVARRARAAGIPGRVGAHSLRHAHATRQVDAGVSLKVVGDILGHHSPTSTSVYVRVALRRLRSVALPVPR